MKVDYRDTVLVLAVAGNFAQLTARLVVSPVVPDIVVAFSTSKSAIGLALTAMWAMYAFIQYPGGVLIDRYGERTLLLAALALTGVGSVLLAYSPSFPFFAAAAVFLGGGTGLFFPAAASLLTRLYRGTGGALGLLTAGGALAGLIAPVAAAFVGVRYGWHLAVALGTVPVVPVLAASVLIVRPLDHRSAAPLRDRFDPAIVRDILSRPAVVFTIVVAIITSFTWQSFASFFPIFLVEYRSFSVEDAGMTFGVVFLISALVQPLVGRLSDSLGRDVVLGTVVTATALGFTGALTGPGRFATLLSVLLLGCGITWAGVISARLMDAFSSAERGVAFGLARSIYLFVGASGSAVTGFLADQAGWPIAFGFIVALLVTALTLLAANRVLRLGM